MPRSTATAVLPVRRRPTGGPAPVVGGRAATIVVAVAVAASFVVLVIALVLGGGRPQPALDGLPDPGPATGWGLPLARLVLNYAAVATIGSLLLSAVLLPRHGHHVGAVRAATTSAIRAGAWLWALAAVVSAALTASDTIGVPPERLISVAFSRSAVGMESTQALLAVAATAGAIGVTSGYARRVGGARLLLVLALCGLMPPLAAGHTAASGDHYLATTALGLHVAAACLWVGGLVALLAYRSRMGSDGPAVLARFSSVAAVCLFVVAGSGLLTAWTRLGFATSSWASPYGAQAVLKAALLLLLGLAGYAHRRRCLPLIRRGRARAFQFVAVADVIVMAATIAVAVALSRTPPPVQATAVIPTPAHGSGHPTLATTVEPFTAMHLLTEWRLDLPAVSLIAAAAGLYLTGVRRLRRRGQQWTARRAAAAGAACVLAVFGTCAGLGVYATALLSAQVAQFLTMALVVPVLVTLAAPVTLARRQRAAVPDRSTPSPARARIGGALLDPTNATLIFTVALFALYATPLLEMSVRDPYPHLLCNVAAVALGCLVFHAILGSHAFRPAPSTRDSRVVLGALLSVLAGFGAVVLTRSTLLGGTWFADLAWTWVTPADDQVRAGQVIWAFVPLVAALGLLAIRASSAPVTIDDPLTARSGAIMIREARGGSSACRATVRVRDHAGRRAGAAATAPPRRRPGRTARRASRRSPWR